MQLILKRTVNIFLAVFVLTAAASLFALVFLWFSILMDYPIKELPFLGWMLGITIAQAASIVILYAKKGLKYLPEVEVKAEEKQTLDFMRKFIASGSSVVIVSNRISWLHKSEALTMAIIEMAKKGTSLEIITPNSISENIRIPLESAGIRFYTTNESIPPEARFTLVNANRSSSEKLAIAKGSHPYHEITIFDNNSGPQIIAMAKDIIRKSKELANAPKME